MTKYVKGSQRLKLIQQYLQGKEDENYEVLPTRVEGKYIIKPRQSPLAKKDVISNSDNVTSDNTNDKANDKANDNTNDNTNNKNNVSKQDSNVNDSVVDDTKAYSDDEYSDSDDYDYEPAHKKKPRKQASYDPTVNLEILNQLKYLGEELRSERAEKQQKKLIKAAVRNQLYKYPNYNANVRFQDDDDEAPAPATQPPQSQPPKLVRRRLNLLNK